MKYQTTLLFLVLFYAAGYGGTADSTILKGKIIDSKTRAGIDAAELDVYHNSDFILDDVQISHHGEYEERLKHLGFYIINISAPGYLRLLDTLWVTNENKHLIEKDYYLTPIEVGLTIVLENVYFHFGTTELKPESFISLNHVVEFFKDHPDVKFEIAGHTDDEGAEDYNLQLSQGRAESVVKYLLAQGVDPQRVTAMGYGESKPIDKGMTKAAKARNRRVEFIIKEIGTN